MNTWTYKGEIIDNIDKVPEGAIGFIYCLTNINTGKQYIGKKYLYSERKKNLTKKEISELASKRLKHWKTVKSESDWLTYNSSSEEIKKEIKEGQLFQKEILYWTFNKISTTYLEIRTQMELRVLESNMYYNNNINSSWFRDNIGI